VQRHIHARKKIRAEEEIRRMDSEEAVLRFNRFENRIERLESEAEVVNLGRKPTLDEKFDHLMDDEEIENELAALKSREQTEERDVSAK
jgi:phage shock protein A